jgi:hypothetical protein
MHQRFADGKRDHGQTLAGDIIGIEGDGAQMIGVANGGDGDAGFAGAGNDGVQRRQRHHRAQAPLAVHRQETRRGPILLADFARHGQSGPQALDHPAQAQQPMAGSAPHLRPDKELGLDAGMRGGNAMPDQHPLYQGQQVILRNQH